MAPQRTNNKANGSALNAVRGSKVHKPKRKQHKVVVESAENENADKESVLLSFDASPPPGFTFIPAGNTQLTAALKAFAKRNGQKIMAVSATPHAARHELSREVHRIGYHFPTEVVSQVCSHYGIRLDKNGRIIGEHDNDQIFMKISQRGEVVLNETVRDQVTINTEAKEIIRDLFPTIPDNDLFSIIKTAFQLGDNKVGTAEEIPLVRRAQLSVVAHIRHTYTNYDKLLRQVPYNEARHQVEKTTLRKLVEWRGDPDKEVNKNSVDDAVREVVVLSDEADSDSELEEGQVDEKPSRLRQQQRSEVITQYRQVSPGDASSGDERIVKAPYKPRQDQVLQIAPEIVSRRQETRYALWDQVRQEYQRDIPTQESAHVIARYPVHQGFDDRHLAGTRSTAYEPPAPVRYMVDDRPPPQIIHQPSPNRLFRGEDGRLYENLPGPTYVPIERIYTPPTRSAAQTVYRRSLSPRPLHRRQVSINDDGTIVRSIEDADMAPPPQLYQSSHSDSAARQSDHGRMIDLTATAERANLRRSPSPVSLHHAPRYERDIDMTDSDDSSRSRKMIILEDRPQMLRKSIARIHEIPAERQFSSHAEARQYDRQSLLRTSLVPAPVSSRQVIYEPLDEPVLRQMRYDTEPVRVSQVERDRYYVLEDEPQRSQSAVRHPHAEYRPVYIENYQNSPLRQQNFR